MVDNDKINSVDTIDGKPYFYIAITYIWQGFHSSHNVGKTSNSLKPRER